eukprot:1275827-Rhodomonas_salina.2
MTFDKNTYLRRRTVRSLHWRSHHHKCRLWGIACKSAETRMRKSVGAGVVGVGGGIRWTEVGTKRSGYRNPNAHLEK